MNIYYLLAGVLCIVLGVTHSVLGEYLIFRHKRARRRLVPTQGSSTLKEGHLRIIWATWHFVTVLGAAIGVLFIHLAQHHIEYPLTWMSNIVNPILIAMFGGSLLVLIGTKGKHPGWIVLLVIAMLLLLGSPKW